jgi:lysophospholipase L1-like esterase
MRVVLPFCAAALVAGAADTTAAFAEREHDAPPPAVFEDPCVDGTDASCRRRALDSVYAALAATEAGTATAPVRISYLGDSVTADDLILQRLRGALQARFGDGGPGFLYAAPPHPYCRQRAARRAVTGKWTVRGIAESPPGDRLMGLGGSSAESYWGTIKLTAKTATLATAEVFYLAHKRGGDLAVTAGGATTTIATAADAKTARYHKVTLPAGTRDVALKVASGTIRLFGVALEASSGVVVDNLGVVNGTAKAFAKNEPAHWKDQLAHRAPDLFVVMLGTNEAEWLKASGAGMEEHERLFTQLVTTARAANPGRACLVISPFDQLDYRTEGMPPRASIPAMVDAQRRGAGAAGCAFWDGYRWMGGKGSSRTWRRKKLVTNDFQHPTEQGSYRIADALAAGLLDGYAAYQQRTGKPAVAARWGNP